MSAPELCPHCGAEVPLRARACPECGADESTGWNERAAAQNLGVADPDDFDAEEFAREEWGPPPRRHLSLGWIAVGIGLLLAMLFAWFR